jgi:phage replication O-like protein O
MARPQRENGFTGIAHEIIENAARFSFNGSQFSILLIVWRFTYGFNRKSHAFAVSFLSEATGLNARAVKRELAALIDGKVLMVVKEATNKASRELAFNKDYEAWKVEKRGDNMRQMDMFEVTNPTPQKQSRGDKSDTQDRYKDLKKDIKDNTVFDDFYKAYPRKIKKEAAKKAWDKLVKEKVDLTMIVLNTINYAETCKLIGTETKYIPHPSTYLNQKQFEDYPTIDPEGLANSTSIRQPNGKYTTDGEILHRRKTEEINERMADIIEPELDIFNRS